MTQMSESYRVVANHEGQFSVVPCNFPLPNGWRDCGISGAKSKCLEYIEKNWRELLPHSVVEQMT